MKKTRSLIFMVVVLAFLVGGFALWQVLGKPGTEIEPTTAPTYQSKDPLVSLKAEDVARIVLRNDAGTIELKPVWAQPTPAPTTTATSELPVTGAAKPTPAPILHWELVSPQLEGLSDAFVDKMGSDLLILTIVDEIGAKAASELSQFGLAEPAATVVYELNSGAKIEAALGAKVSASESARYYAMSKGETDSRVVVVTSVAEKLQKSALSLLDRNVVNLTVEDLYSFTLQREGEEFLLSGVSLPVETVGQDGSKVTLQDWQMKTPIEWKANGTNITNFLTEVVQLQAEEFFEYSAEKLASYGLDKPQYKITLRSAEGDKVLLIGQAKSSNEAYAMLEGQAQLFSFNRSVLTQAGIPAIDFYDSFAALVNITDVGKLTVTLDGEEYLSTIFNPTRAETDAAKAKGDPEPKPAYTLNGKDANVINDNDDNLFTRYYQTVIGVTLAGFDPDASPKADQAIYTVQYEMRNENPDIQLAYVARDAQTLYLLKNGEYTGFYVDQDKFTADSNIDSPGVKLAIEILQAEITAQQTAATTTAVETSESTGTSRTEN